MGSLGAGANGGLRGGGMRGDSERTPNSFRERASELMAEAKKADDPAIREAYLELAAEWKRLAQMAEERLKTTS
jgi:hypothetical protein